MSDVAAHTTPLIAPDEKSSIPIPETLSAALAKLRAATELALGYPSQMVTSCWAIRDLESRLLDE